MPAAASALRGGVAAAQLQGSGPAKDVGENTDNTSTRSQTKERVRVNIESKSRAPSIIRGRVLFY